MHLWKGDKNLGRALPPPSFEQNPKEQQLFSSLSQFNQTMPTPVPPSNVCANFDQVKCQVSSIMCDGQYDQLAAGWSAVVK